MTRSSTPKTKAPVLQLLFFHTNGCEDCKKVAPSVTTLAREQNIPLTMVHAPDRENGPLISRYMVSEIPTVLLLHDNKIAIESTGPKLATKALLQYLEKHRNAKAPR